MWLLAKGILRGPCRILSHLAGIGLGMCGRASEARKGQKRLRSPSSSASHLGPVHLSTLEWILMYYTSSPGKPQNQIQPQMPWPLVAGSKRNRCRLVWHFAQSFKVIHFMPSGTNHFLCPCHLPWEPITFSTVPF